jgi:heptaprenyl diphosphate synthase
MILQRIYRECKRDLRGIEKRLAEAIHTDHAALYQMSSHLLQAGGKRMRPIFVTLASHFGTFDRESVKQIAVTLELIHMATLVHDDVIDNAKTRRGQLTVKEKWDEQAAMVTGDYIFSAALTEVSSIEDPRVHRILANTMVEVCRGEIEQIRDLYRINPSVKRYFHRIKRKTALLMAISCQLGALVCQAPPKLVNQLYLYGYYVGMAFQMIDDVLDFTGTEKVLGKPAGSDIKQGNVTLPVVYALHQQSEVDTAPVIAYLQTKGQEGELAEVLEIIKRAGGIEYTTELAKRYLQKAIDILEQLPPIHQRDLLREVTEFVLARSY